MKLVGSLIGLLGWALIAFCVGTTVTEAVAVSGLASSGVLTRDKMTRYAAIVYGFDVTKLDSDNQPDQTSADAEEALAAASAIGDDRLQKEASGRVVPESFTHGTSRQRVEWFRRGIESGDVGQCNTFDS